MKTIVIFDTRFGNTEKVANSLGVGLGEAGIQTVCVQAKDVVGDSLDQFYLISVGAPTEAFSASKPMKVFLEKIRGVDLSGKYGFAFDTKLDSRLSGSAAKFIEHALDDLGLRIIVPRESAIVFTLKKKSAIIGARIKEGEEKRFKQIGLKIGTALAARGSVVDLTQMSVHQMPVE